MKVYLVKLLKKCYCKDLSRGTCKFFGIPPKISKRLLKKLKKSATDLHG